ncbi:MAG: redox-sensing transcriptional repressor Rex [Bacteroidales bacterium]|jgi:redox-sensing transcriptional repressor|nr:redox-sensing transcriptional repressor Rex [Bacteroidales bacterium]MCK9448354.1 redox-sensing transcriptional repressor Rex [Bacteroidales bacterium]MDD3702139.1 redox-sensing transcriptional repressor Rex [Bacteroidales bacterium]MDY0369942.1 redox-sensing transcriptional repressor Rex [Bacteroidales bacterium]
METTLSSSAKQSVAVPEPTVRRLPTYLNIIKNLQQAEHTYVSAPTLARILRLDPTQVTKDLSYTGVIGKTRVGYQISELVEALEDFLGFNRKHEAFLVGAGYLGSALIQYQGFRESGMRIVAAFDIDKNKIGTDIAGVPVFHLEKFRDLTERLHITIGIITTPPSAAQNVADLMIGWGIKAIWNFAPIGLKVPEHIILQDTHIYANLAVILNKLDHTALK